MIKKEIEILTAEVHIDRFALAGCTQEEINERVKFLLATELTNYLLTNLEELPTEITSRAEPTGKVFSLKLNLVSDEAVKKLLPEKKQVLKNYPAHEAIRILFPGKKNYYRLSETNPALCVHVGELISINYSSFERMPTEKNVIPLTHVHSTPTKQDIYVGICQGCGNLFYYVDGETITLIQEV